MWSIFSRDPSKDFAYEINEPVFNDEKSFWILHNGKRKVLDLCNLSLIF